VEAGVWPGTPPALAGRSLAPLGGGGGGEGASKGDFGLKSLRPLAHVYVGGIPGTYAVLLVKPSANGGADIVGSLSNVNDALVKALILRMAKAQVEAQAADKELGSQVSRESTDLLAANDEQQLKVVNG